MALDRKYQKIFAKNARSTDLGVVGSKMAGNPQYNTDIETLQSLSNWETGLRSQVSNSNAPYLQDQNSIFYVITSQLAYLFQAGIAEWNSQTEYVANRSIVLKNGKIYIAITNNTNVEPEVTTGWETYWKSLVDWGFIQGNIYKQTDLWNAMLKGIYFESIVSSAIGGYPKGARVLYNDGNGNKYYIESLKDNNSTSPTEENIYKAPMTFQKVTGVVNTTSNLPTASEDTTSDIYLCLADSKVYFTAVNHSTTPNTYYWSGLTLSGTETYLDTNTSDFYVLSGGQVVSASSVYDWIAYNTQIKPPIIGVTKYALEHLQTGTKETVYQTTKPTVVIFGALTEQTNKSWFLDVSTDGVNFKTIAGGKFSYQGETMHSVILDKDLYWQVRTDISSTSDYRIEYSSLY